MLNLRFNNQEAFLTNPIQDLRIKRQNKKQEMEEKRIIISPENILNSIELLSKIFPIRELVAPNAIKIKEKPTVNKIIGKILTFFSSRSSFNDLPDT